MGFIYCSFQNVDIIDHMSQLNTLAKLESHLFASRACTRFDS